jgi:hypothetical protein
LGGDGEGSGKSKWVGLTPPEAFEFGRGRGGVNRLSTTQIFNVLIYLVNFTLAGMSIAAIGFYGSKGPFWAIPWMILTGTAAASGIAWINSVGNRTGGIGPVAKRSRSACRGAVAIPQLPAAAFSSSDCHETLGIAHRQDG